MSKYNKTVMTVFLQWDYADKSRHEVLKKWANI